MLILFYIFYIFCFPLIILSERKSKINYHNNRWFVSSDDKIIMNNFFIKLNKIKNFSNFNTLWKIKKCEYFFLSHKNVKNNWNKISVGSITSSSNNDKITDDVLDGISYSIRDNTHIFKDETKDIPIILLHGCYGSRKNFIFFSKLLKSNKVITMDLRNHGDSKHTENMRFDEIENDIKNVLQKLHIKKCCLIGFSLGGKASMYCALKNSSLFSHLIIMDILPFNYNSNKVHIKLPFNISQVTSILYHIKHEKKPRNKLEFLQYLKCELPDISNSFAQFLCMSLKENNDKNQLTWKINIEAIYKDLPFIMNFPLNPEEYKYHNPCSFIIAKKSDLVCSIPNFDKIIKDYFPSASQVILDNSTHTVYIDEAQQCANIINEMLNK
ncbi:putative alpha/beta hydrolase [Plasmodium gaboni]|uniref:Alpha/beta hydrolase, putative n=1 Tax=Plasmodium gaboni TaxID=647221 RepID=A0A151LJF0_9APIC|nr:putative alpha/beta hydrolase [Plasmodium gaboni]KYN99064.1 putative alpha/beta hydrolase [Plasmodium gaboni]SOV16032.1 alpha/beta hydrolase, putative [Plasmodium gaboni]SOV23502.1 alpha/beta hydrolase, putative [Plasmodium sp. DRC-Itaito]